MLIFAIAMIFFGSNTFAELKSRDGLGYPLRASYPRRVSYPSNVSYPKNESSPEKNKSASGKYYIYIK